MGHLRRRRMRFERLQNNINLLKKFSNNKRIASSLFSQLERQYLTKLDYSNTQKNLLSKINSLESLKKDKIKNNKEILENTNSSIQTNKRKLMYDQRENKLYTTIFSVLKLVLLIMGIAVIILLSKKKYKFIIGYFIFFFNYLTHLHLHHHLKSCY